MIKRLSVVLALVVGVVLGYAARDLPFGTLQDQANETETTDSNESSLSDVEAGQRAGRVVSVSPTESDSPEVRAFPSSETLLNYILPDRALAQVRIDATGIRDSSSEEDLPALLSQQAVQELVLSMSETARPSFGPLISELAVNAQLVHLFLLPPKGDIPVPTLLVVAKWQDVGYEDLHRCLRDPVLAGLEDGETYSKSVGEFTMEGVRAPTGNVSYVVTEHSVWLCNSRDALAEVFAMESLPKPEGSPALQSLLAHVPEGPVVAAVNLRPQPDGSAGPSGVLALLAGLGIERIALGWGGTPATLALFGEFKETPPWAEEWPPLPHASRLTPHASSLAVLHASLPPMPAMDSSSPMMGGFRSRGRRGGESGQSDRSFGEQREPRRDRRTDREPRQFNQSFGEQREAFRDRGADRQRPRMGSRRSGSLQFRAMAVTRFLPQAQSVSLRLALGEEEPVVWSATFRGDSEKLADWRERIESMPGSQAEDAGPNLRRVAGGMLSMIWGVDQLLIADRGDNLVLYASEESSRLLSPPGGGTGEVVMDSPSSGGGSEQPQIHAGISGEFLHMLVAGEKNSLDPRAPNAAMVADLLNVLAGFTSPITFDLTILPDGIRARVQAEHQMAAALGPVFIASAFMRGGI